MKILVVTLFALVALAASKSIDVEDVINLEEITAYDYLAKVGKPLADEIREAEAEREASRIVGGSGASVGQFPYQAGLLISFSLGQGVCGGSLLNAARVLTAAHCWFDGVNQASLITVVLGSVNLFTGGTRVNSNNVVVHNNWIPLLVRNDVAMIILPSTVSLTANIAPIALPSGNELSESFAGEVATASGFGATSDGGGASTTLNHVNLAVITNTECWATFPIIIQANNICTSGAGGRSTCRGDSGGPLVVWRNNRRILVGATSFGHAEGCQRGHPAAYARVTGFITWINGLL